MPTFAHQLRNIGKGSTKHTQTPQCILPCVPPQEAYLQSHSSEDCHSLLHKIVDGISFMVFVHTRSIPFRKCDFFDEVKMRIVLINFHATVYTCTHTLVVKSYEYFITACIMVVKVVVKNMQTLVCRLMCYQMRYINLLWSILIGPILQS